MVWFLAPLAPNRAERCQDCRRFLDAALAAIRFVTVTVTAAASCTAVRGDTRNVAIAWMSLVVARLVYDRRVTEQSN